MSEPDGPFRRTIDQLRHLRDEQHWASERVGAPGCIARRMAADHVEALDEAMNALRLLSDPQAVHLNMLRGTIAKPSPANIRHIYGKALERP